MKPQRRWLWAAVCPQPGAPLLAAVPVVEGAPLGAAALLEYLLALEGSGGASTAPPPAVGRVLASKACRRAAMFGDTLALPRCQEIVDALARCELPTSCAHGRPTVTALVDVGRLSGGGLDE